jgi:hypothetical protein
MNEQDDLWVVTVCCDTLDPAWRQATTIIARPEKLAELFGDLGSLPAGFQLLKGKQAKRFLKRAVKNQLRFQEELKFKRGAGGTN